MHGSGCEQSHGRRTDAEGFPDWLLVQCLLMRLALKLNEEVANIHKPWMLHYYNFEGTAEFTSAAVAFVSRYFKPLQPIAPAQLLGVLGTCSVFDIVAHAVADPGGPRSCFLAVPW